MFYQIIINGIMLGTVYALLALGVNLIFGVMNILNFAHGQMYMIGTFIAYYIYGVFSHNYFIAIVLAIITLGIVGLVLHRGLFKSVLHSAKRSEVTMLLSMGTALLLENSALMLFGEKRRGIPPLVEGVFNYKNILIPKQRVVILLMAMAIIVLFLLFMNYTKMGVALRAIAQDKDVTNLMGVDVNNYAMYGFGIGGALAGVAGVILALIFPISSGVGTSTTIKAFTMIIIGGAGVSSGAIIGGFILGMAEAIGYGYIGGAYTYVAIYLSVIVFLIFKPNGLVGRPWG